MKFFRPVTQTVMAAQWDGTNEDEVRELLGPDRAFPPIGWWVVARSGGVDVIEPAAFAASYEPASTFS